ncbi:MAG TPA: hypothetical protein VF284_06895 [Rhodanobacteraceae bacterium]
MKTTIPTEFPPPIVNDVYLPASTGEVDRSGIDTGTRLNLVTGEYRIAELIRGVLYDTDRSTLVASVTAVDAANGFYLRRLYRTEAGHWFIVHFTWWHHLFATADAFLWPIPDDGVLAIAMALVPDKDCLGFILDWYAAGLIPRNDAAAKAWAERVLAEVDLEAAHAAIASLPAKS